MTEKLDRLPQVTPQTHHNNTQTEVLSVSVGKVAVKDFNPGSSLISALHVSHQD